MVMTNSLCILFFFSAMLKILVVLVSCCLALPVSIVKPFGCIAALATGACAFSTLPTSHQSSQIPLHSSTALEVSSSDYFPEGQGPYSDLPPTHPIRLAWEAKLKSVPAEWNKRSLLLEDEDSLLDKQSKLFMRNKELLDKVIFLDGDLTATWGVFNLLFNQIGI
jgi:hypothetical protein